ncbi:MAG: MerR family transcriptional regulator, partial [Dermatophilaceae bacterium]
MTLRIGQVAHATGVSRRMLRHWEDAGLLAPAAVDPVSDCRWYAPSQVGRVRAIASLRAAGFGLEAITDLLGEALSEQQLVELLED